MMRPLVFQVAGSAIEQTLASFVVRSTIAVKALSAVRATTAAVEITTALTNAPVDFGEPRGPLKWSHPLSIELPAKVPSLA